MDISQSQSVFFYCTDSKILMLIFLAEPFIVPHAMLKCTNIWAALHVFQTGCQDGQALLIKVV